MSWLVYRCGEKMIPQRRFATWTEAQAYQPTQNDQVRSELKLRSPVPARRFANSKLVTSHPSYASWAKEISFALAL